MTRDQAIETVLGVLRWWFAFEKKPESLPLLAERIVDALGVGQPDPELERLRRLEAAAREVVDAIEYALDLSDVTVLRAPRGELVGCTRPASVWREIKAKHDALRAVLSEEVPGADPGIGLEGAAGESRVPERRATEAELEALKRGVPLPDDAMVPTGWNLEGKVLSQITHSQAESVATMLRLDAFAEATAAKVRQVALGGSLDDPALESAILQALEEAGLPLNA